MSSSSLLSKNNISKLKKKKNHGCLLTTSFQDNGVLWNTNGIITKISHKVNKTVTRILKCNTLHLQNWKHKKMSKTWFVTAVQELFLYVQHREQVSEVRTLLN